MPRTHAQIKRKRGLTIENSGGFRPLTDGHMDRYKAHADEETRGMSADGEVPAPRARLDPHANTAVHAHAKDTCRRVEFDWLPHYGRPIPIRSLAKPEESPSPESTRPSLRRHPRSLDEALKAQKKNKRKTQETEIRRETHEVTTHADPPP